MTALEIIRQQAFLEAADLIGQTAKSISQGQDDDYTRGALEACRDLQDQFLYKAHKEITK